MRLALLFVIALSACASKKQAPRSPASPAAPAATEQPKEETGATNVDSDKDADDPKPLSSDPEEGGQ
jgi:hypothetical protein